MATVQNAILAAVPGMSVVPGYCKMSVESSIGISVAAVFRAKTVTGFMFQAGFGAFGTDLVLRYDSGRRKQQTGSRYGQLRYQ